MGFRPPKGVRPPQLEGKRTGRPKGSKNFATVWADPLWGYAHRDDDHRDDDHAVPPTPGAWLWSGLAGRYPNQVREWLEACNQL